MDKGIVVFTGYNTRAVVAFCRFLKSRGLQAHLIAKCPEDPIFLTDFRDWVLFIRGSLELEINQCIEYFKAIKSTFAYQTILIAPTSEFLNRFFLANQSFIQKESVSIPLVNLQLYKDVSDKHPFRVICRENGFGAPATLSQGSKTFPYVAKKYRYDASYGIQSKPYLIFNESDYQTFSQRESLEAYYFEEYVAGESYYLLYHISRSGVVSSYAQQNFIQQANGRSIIAARPSDIHTHSIGEQYGQLLVSLGFHGLAMIEVRKYRETYLMIEANPRFWGPLQLVVDNCPALLEEFLLDQQIQLPNGHTQDNPARPLRNYFWYGGYISDRMLDRTPSFHQYAQTSLNDELHKWLASDVFLQEDTIKLFKVEIEGNLST